MTKPSQAHGSIGARSSTSDVTQPTTCSQGVTSDMETWGSCSTCNRWFYCPAGNGEADELATRHCPVCGDEPATIELRAAT